MAFRLLVSLVAWAGVMLAVAGTTAAQEAPPAGTPVPIGDPCAAVPGGTPVPDLVPAGTPIAAVPFDAVFLDLVMPHQERLQGIAAVAALRAEHDDLRVLAEEIYQRAGERQRDLQAWRAEWYGEVPPLEERDLVAAIDRLAAESPGRMGLPGAFEMLAMAGMVADLCAHEPDDQEYLGALIGALNAEILLAGMAPDLAARPDLTEYAASMAGDDQRWLDALIAYHHLWYEGTPIDRH